ncbi:MAG: hydrogenase, partial [Oscillospiraceae bacterium]|nr:hydrogenase [Oscillospiraceae bacterium]
MNEVRVYGGHIVQTPPEYSFCAGCNSCEAICSLVHDGVVSPSRRRLTVRRDIRTMAHTVYSCQHCSDRPCYEKCPKKGEAMILG